MRHRGRISGTGRNPKRGGYRGMSTSELIFPSIVLGFTLVLMFIAIVCKY